MGNSWKARLGIDYVANELPMDDGVVTARWRAAYRRRSAEGGLARALAAQEGLARDQVIAIGDGANDLPMLAAAGWAMLYRAKPLVRLRQAMPFTLGLDGLLYLLGFTDDDFAA